MGIDIALDVQNSLSKDDLDIIVLMTGDSDFLRLTRDCCEKGKRVMIYAFDKNLT